MAPVARPRGKPTAGLWLASAAAQLAGVEARTPPPIAEMMSRLELGGGPPEYASATSAPMPISGPVASRPTMVIRAPTRESCSTAC